MNNSNIVVFDFETGGLDPYKCAPIQLAAAVINPRTLELLPGAVFESMMCPMTEQEFNSIEDGALKVNKKTREQIKAAPVESLVWKQFTDFIKRYTNTTNPPVPAGQFIQGYDMIIIDRLCKKYGPWDKVKNKQCLFDDRTIVDLKNITWLWFENSSEPENLKLDTLRDYLGLSKEKAHDAKQDVLDTANIIIRFIKLHRTLSRKVTFKGAFACSQQVKT